MREPLSGIVLICSFLCWAGGGWAQSKDSIKTIVAKGEAIVSPGQKGKAKAEALVESFIAGVEIVAAELVEPLILSANRDLLRKKTEVDTQKYVMNHKIVQEEACGEKLCITTSIAIRVDRLRKDLKDWGFVFERPTRPNFVIFPFEDRKGDHRSSGWTGTNLAKKMAARLRGLGFSAEEIFSTAGRKVGNSSANDIVVHGAVSVVPRAGLSAILESFLTQERAGPIRVAVHLSLEDGDNLAGGLLASALVQQTLPVWLRDVDQGTNYSLVVTGLQSYQNYQEIRDFLNQRKMGFFLSKEQSYAPSMAAFDVVFYGTRADFVRVLGQINLSRGKLSVLAQDGNVVRTEFR